MCYKGRVGRMVHLEGGERGEDRVEPTLKKLYYKSIIKTCVDSVDGCCVCELVLLGVG